MSPYDYVEVFLIPQWSKDALVDNGIDLLTIKNFEVVNGLYGTISGTDVNDFIVSNINAYTLLGIRDYMHSKTFRPDRVNTSGKYLTLNPIVYPKDEFSHLYSNTALKALNLALSGEYVDDPYTVEKIGSATILVTMKSGFVQFMTKNDNRIALYRAILNDALDYAPLPVVASSHLFGAFLKILKK